jgi:hypothetical protein
MARFDGERPETGEGAEMAWVDRQNIQVGLRGRLGASALVECTGSREQKVV